LSNIRWLGNDGKNGILAPGITKMSLELQMHSELASAKIERELNKVRAKKIAKLRDKIASGKYHVDNVKLAKALFMAR